MRGNVQNFQELYAEGIVDDNLVRQFRLFQSGFLDGEDEVVCFCFGDCMASTDRYGNSGFVGEGAKDCGCESQGTMRRGSSRVNCFSAYVSILKLRALLF
jgi:hypothetical protein